MFYHFIKYGRQMFRVLCNKILERTSSTYNFSNLTLYLLSTWNADLQRTCFVQSDTHISKLCPLGSNTFLNCLLIHSATCFKANFLSGAIYIKIKCVVNMTWRWSRHIFTPDILHVLRVMPLEHGHIVPVHAPLHACGVHFNINVKDNSRNKAFQKVICNWNNTCHN